MSLLNIVENYKNKTVYPTWIMQFEMAIQMQILKFVRDPMHNYTNIEEHDSN